MILDKQYYTDTFKGTLVPQEQLDNLLETATYDIHTLTFNRSFDHTNLTAFQLNLVQRAICHQAEHLYVRNDPSMLDVQSISSDGSSIAYKGSTRYSTHATNLILQSGLGYSGFY